MTDVARAAGAAPLRAAPEALSAISATGTEWLVEAFGCDPARLADVEALHALFARLEADLALTPIGESRWHQFPGAAGITGMALLAESHLTVHTWPEHRSLCLNLFCCRPRGAWDWEGGLRAMVGAGRVVVRAVSRDYVARDE